MAETTMRFGIPVKVGLSAGLLVALLTWFTGVQFYQNSRVILTHHEEDSLRDEADLSGRRILADIDRLEKTCQFLAGEHATQALLWNEWQRKTQTNVDGNHNEEKERQDLADLFQSSLAQTRGHFYMQIALIRKDHTEIVSIRNTAFDVPEQPALKKESQPGWLDEAMLERALTAKANSAEVYSSGIRPIAGLPAGAPVRLQLQVAVPLFYPESKLGLYGALVVRADFSRLLESRNFNLSPRRIFFLTDGQGHFLAHPDPRRIWATSITEEPALQELSVFRPEAELGPVKERVERLHQKFEPVALPEIGYWLAIGELPVKMDQSQRDKLQEILEQYRQSNPSLRFNHIDDLSTRILISSRNRGDVAAMLDKLKHEFQDQPRLGREFGSLIRWHDPVKCHTFAIDSLKLDHPEMPMNLMVAASYEEIEDDIRAAFSHFKWLVLGVSAAAAVIAFLFSRFFSRRISRVSYALRNFAEGTASEFSLPEKSRDEIGILARAFHRMVDTVRQREDALHESEARIRTILSSAHDGILTLDEKGTIESLNATAERMFGYRESDVLGKDYRILFQSGGKDVFQSAGDNHASPYASSELSIRKVTGFTKEVTGRRKDGSTFPVEISVSQVPVGNRLIFTGILRDITERKQIEEQNRHMKEWLEQRVRERTAQLEQANHQLQAAAELALEASRAKDAFLATMSHELRTPLNAIIGYCDLMLEDPEHLEPKETAQDLLKIRSSGKHLLGLINDILDLAKIESGKMRLEISEFELTGVIQDLRDLMDPLIQARSNKLTIEIAPNLGRMHSDRMRVRQLLLNLLSNANKFTDHGSIGLRAWHVTVDSRDWIEISVSDTGRGISPEDLKKLFQPFFQADATSTRKHEGTGLGLAISRRFANLMGGDIAVQSELGKGSTFTVRLPAETVVDEPHLSPSRHLEAPKNDGRAGLERLGQPVLIVDDDSSVLDLMSRFLSKEGFAVRTAATGEEGIRLAKEIRPLAITLDALMPEMDGWAVLATLKSDPATAQIPIIMVTIIDDKSRGFALGASDYLTKPIDWVRLSAILKSYADVQTAPILVVDDDRMAREVTARMLRRLGWQVMEAENGREALAQFGKKRPAVILLDLMMPEMDGFQFVEELRKLPEGRDTPVIVVTARDLTEHDRQRLHGSVQEVLQKSAVSPEAVVREVQQRISQASLGDQLKQRRKEHASDSAGGRQ
jgi:PAS domain S-box-containing protein